MSLEAVKINVWYGQARALCDASLTVPPGSVTALIGPSGCGKSTFLRALNRMHDLVPGARVSGTVRLDGQDTRKLKAEELRCRIGMVFQRPNPFPMSIYENVGFGPALFGVPKAERSDIVKESLKRAALWDEVKGRLGADARSLSGGQQQRLCIARALAMDPAVLLMDEPCSALDPGSTQAVEELILTLRSAMTILIVTHSMGQARRVADQVAFFHSGRLLETGTEILDQPRTKELAEFLAH